MAGCSAFDEERVGAIPTMLTVLTQTPPQPQLSALAVPIGRKASDEFAVPLCRIHHRLVHRVGNESAWWEDAGIDPIKTARKLWKYTLMAAGRIEPEPTAQRAALDRTAKSEVQAVDSQTPVHRD